MDRVTVLLAKLFFAILLVTVYNNVVSADEDVDWWKTALIYQILPRSFKDSDNDGNGDLQGIIQKLDYLKDLGVDAIWLNPMFKSPQVDVGYDVADYRDVDPIYGTLDDLRQLIDEAHELNIKVLLDYVPNHTSDQHAWFQASVQKDPKYDSYYIWKNATYIMGRKQPPNNWISCYSGPAWTWNDERQQYYFHQFSSGQPDLNYRNPAVVEEMKDVLRYWLNFGVDGFRTDAVTTLFEDILFRDEPHSGTPGFGPDDHEYLNHIYTLIQAENFDMVYQWRSVYDEFNQENNTYNRVMITEGSSDPDTLRYFYASPDESRLGAHFTFNFITFITQLHYGFDAVDLSLSATTWMDAVPFGFTNNWMLGNHDRTRVSTRLGVENIDALNMLVSILPGAQITYQGEEIGQENGEVTCEEGTDPQAINNCSTFDQRSRDFQKTPFQWDDSINAGFNDGAKTWLPVSEKYVDTNLAKQNVSDVKTHFNIYKQMLKIRQELKYSSNYEYILGTDSDQVFYFQRITDTANYAFYYNTGDSEKVINTPVCVDCMTVAVTSGNSDYKPGDTFNVSQPLKPREAVVSKVADS